MKKRRPYNTLGRRIIAILEVGGQRKYNVLLGYAASLQHSKDNLDRTLERLVDAGLLKRKSHRRGGVHYDLAKRHA